MPWVLIILIVVVAIGLFGFLSSKVDELSGIGREHTAGSFRWPHGKVVRTRILSAEKEHERGEIAKKVLLPQTSFTDFATVPPELMSAFQLIPYQSAEDAVFKALGVE